MRAYLLPQTCFLVAMLCACSSNSSGGSRTSTAAGNTGGGSGIGGATSTAGGSVGIGGGVALSFGGTSSCDSANPSASCSVTAAPGCGDGKINQASEQCDDGNSVPGDGCSGICQLEPYYTCPTPGQPCVSTIICGDGIVGPGEACDDGNKASGDGCSATCTLVEPGYVCKTPAQPCQRVYVCGDGIVDPNEGCDDGNHQDGDGCDSKCRIELGFKCSGAPSVCSTTTCGDHVVEGAESCDDGNTIPFDGCSETCQAEPNCPTTGSCGSVCGDGIVLGEECDDGNLRNGDGCSSTCKLEPGFVCSNDSPCQLQNGKCTMSVPVVFRDFNFSGSSGGHPDFQPGHNSGHDVVTGLVQTTWDSAKKPVFSGKATCVTIDKNTGARTSTACDPLADAFVHSSAGFAEWYRDGAPSGGPIPSTLRLWDNGKGGYVNRFGANGEQWAGYPQGTVNGVTYPSPQQCSNTTSCADPNCVAPPVGAVCLGPCVPWGANSTQSCFATPVLYDGSPLFFPLDPPHPGILNDARRSAKVPEQYGYTGWPWEQDVGPAIGLQPSNVSCDAADAHPGSKWCHNFSFTTEVKYWFKFDSSASARLDFTGDDDVWVFVNGTLAVDLGGWHVPLDGSITIDSTSAAKFGLQNGQVYEIGVFQAERETEGSSFRLTLSGFNLTPSDCRTNCGDGIVATGEQCDDGSANNTGAYNHCNPDCTLGPRCGDAIKQVEHGEQCDDGKNDGSYGGCAPNCQIGPRCGDGVVQTQYEKCDDGMNTGDYGMCAPGCVPGPHCGDGILQSDHEECDDGNNMDGDGCSAACKKEVPK